MSEGADPDRRPARRRFADRRPLARSAGLAAGVRPRSLRLCADPFPQSRPRARLGRGHGGGAGRAARVLALGARHDPSLRLAGGPRGARARQARRPPELAHGAMGGGADRARPLDPDPRRRPCGGDPRSSRRRPGSTIPTRRSCGFSGPASRSASRSFSWWSGFTPRSACTIGFGRCVGTPPWSPVLLVGAVLVPTLAITGWIEAARRLSLKRSPSRP